MLDHCLFDENDKREIYENQLTLIDDLYKQLDDKKEEVRKLLIEKDKLTEELSALKDEKISD